MLTHKLLVTYRFNDSRTFEAALAAATLTHGHTTEHKAPGHSLFRFKKTPRTAEELQIQLVSGLIDRFLDIRPEISSQLERWQRDLLSSTKRFQDWNALLSARNELTRLESVAEDQTDALSDWLDHKDRKNKAEHTTLVKARDALEHLERISNLARRLGESTEAAVQLHFSATSHKTNEIITVLTILSAVFMPLTLLTGLFGMNFQHMPLIDNPSGFWIAMALMVGLSTGLVLLILRLRTTPGKRGKKERA
ncbi:MAG: hypothetical protein HC848_07425 [Limnobacter sp.]|nr:hypothetical protein [Limnobacter sp.]